MAKPQFRILSGQLSCANASTKALVLTVRNDSSFVSKATVIFTRKPGSQEAAVAPETKQTAQVLPGQTATVVFYMPTNFMGDDVLVAPGDAGSKAQVAADSDACIA